MKDKLVSKEQLQDMFSSLGGLAAGSIMRLFNFHAANRIYDRSKQFEGVEFAKALLDDLGVKVEVENESVLERFREGPFITIANHPYGHIDALSLLTVVGKARPDYKITANFILTLIDTLNMHFIAMDPYARKGMIKASALDAIAECLQHVRDGHPLGFFPAGTISYLKWRGLKPRVEDIAWKEVTVKIIQRSKVPIIPVHISGRNSRKFYSLGMIHWKARYLRLVHELENKQGHKIKLTFGEPIMPDQLQGMEAKKTAELLFGKVYELGRKQDNK